MSRGSRFRLRRRNDRPWIYVREYRDGVQLRTFVAGAFRLDSEEDVEAVYRLCLEANARGVWKERAGSGAATASTWGQFAAQVTENLRQRIPKRASRAHAEGHLRTIATFSGPVSAVRLERWAKECDPITQASPFRKRVETLAQVHASGLMDLEEVLTRLRALRPRGSAKRRQEQRTMRPRAIPPDPDLQEWLDHLSGLERWTFALIATYGLRPSEAWHAEGIDERGWITIPGDGLTKTGRHYAPPVPREWVERYGLAEQFQRRQAELLDRWPLRWEERDGLRVPVNNSLVANYLYKLFQLRGLRKLWAGAVDGTGPSGNGLDWVRPYDLRHAYAVRCFTHPEVNLLPTEDHAQWMGHGLDVHERIYLRWMPASRQKLALQERHTRLASGDGQELPAAAAPAPDLALPPDIAAKLAKLEQLEALLRG